MIKFSEILEENWLKTKLSLDKYRFHEYKKLKTDYIKRSFGNEFSKQLLSKIEIQETERVYTIDFESEFFIFNREKLFELLYTFNRLNLEKRDAVIKYLSPSEEKYQNFLRNETISDIFPDDDDDVNF
jgi:hypothetical protein